MEGLPGHPVPGPRRRARNRSPGRGRLLNHPRRLVLLRHGRTADNLDGRFQGQLDTPLDEVGREQARDAADALAAFGPSVLLTSHLARARATATEVGRVVGLEPVVDHRLAELDLGSWQGLTRDEVGGLHPDQYAAWRRGEDVVRGGGESYRDAGLRATACVEEHLPSVPPGTTLLAVSHGGTGRALLGSLLGLPQESWGRLVVLGNCCWSVLVEADQGWRLEQHGVGAPSGQTRDGGRPEPGWAPGVPGRRPL